MTCFISQILEVTKNYFNPKLEVTNEFYFSPNLEVLTENSKHLDRVISDTNELAEKVSSKVRILDLAKVGSSFSCY